MPQNDPYAAFGGAVQKQAADADPYAAFGGGVASSEAPLSLGPGTPGSGATGRFVSGLVKAINPLPTISAIAGDPEGLKHGIEQSLFQPQADQFNKASDAAHGRGEFKGLGALGRASSAVGHGAAGALPLLGPAAADIGDQIGEGDVAGGLGAATGLLLPAVVPGVMRRASRAARAAAVPTAESALNIRAMDRAYGKTPGTAILDETHGLHPATVAESARQRLADLNAELDHLVNRATNTGSLQPARDVIANRARTAAAGNSAYTPAELAEMNAHLTEPQPGFGGTVVPAPGPQPGIATIADLQDPATILRMKREFGKDFTKWNPLHPKGEINTARQVYRALDDELDRTVPGADALNQRLSSLMPVAERAESSDLNAGVGQRVAHRVAAHTGALAGAGLGYATGGPLGAVAGLVVPEILSSPTARMAAARTLNATGRVLANPVAGRITEAGAAAGAAVNTSKPKNPYRQ